MIKYARQPYGYGQYLWSMQFYIVVQINRLEFRPLKQTSIIDEVQGNLMPEQSNLHEKC